MHRPKRAENYAEWYQSVVKDAELAEHSAVRGCMIIKPWGYGIWENIRKILDEGFKGLGVQNAYFPLFIPLSFLEKEAAHVEGFAKECAVVTHHRLAKSKTGGLEPAAPLDEPLIIRPTSETIIGDSFAKWITSYRDLPLLINQWANIVRWEMRPRLFLRTCEFLWQEGHTAHATAEEAKAFAQTILSLYTKFVEEVLAIPLIVGEKTPVERFPGAVATYTLEAMMQDGKALQGGTSHFLGQNFSTASDIRFRSAEGKEEFAWTTSWGVTTRLIGALIMVHGDDHGLILPPRISPCHLVLIPVVHKEEMRPKIFRFCEQIQAELAQVRYGGERLDILRDDRDIRGGEKSWSWIKRGVPLRIEVGAREVEEGAISLFKRTEDPKKAFKMTLAELSKTVVQELDGIQNTLYERARTFRDSHLVHIETKEAFFEFFERDEKGFVLAGWSEAANMEDELREKLAVTVRCLPFHLAEEKMTCLFTGKKGRAALYAKAY